MAYLSLYRKYRSQTFSDLMGQDHVVRTLQNGIASGRIAHSYLFTGPRGTGKTSSARLLAKALCCEKGPTSEPCNECHICAAITEGSLVDVYEMDAASESGVSDVRDTIVEVVEYKPNIARYKVFIIDEVHDLSPKAFDALLKTIEEPPEHVIFVLATTEFNKVPPTVRSRCQKFEFHRASVADLVKRLTHVAQQEGVEAEPAALTAIARMADGGYRDALTLLEQAILTSEGGITLQHVYDQLGLIGEEVVDDLLLAMRDGDVPKLVEKLAEVSRLGRDPRTILESMLYRLSDLTRALLGIDVGASTDATSEAATHSTATRLGRDELLRLRTAIAEAHKVIRDISLPRLWLEAELCRVAMQPRGNQAVAVAAVTAPASPPAKAVAPPPTPARETTPPAPEAAVPAATTDAWALVKAKLAEKSDLMKVKLAGSRLGSVNGKTYVVEFERQMDLEWVQAGPKRMAALHETLRAVVGGDCTVEYVVKARQSRREDPVAVELPAEGQKLAQMAKEVFGG